MEARRFRGSGAKIITGHLILIRAPSASTRIDLYAGDEGGGRRGVEGSKKRAEAGGTAGVSLALVLLSSRDSCFKLPTVRARKGGIKRFRGINGDEIDEARELSRLSSRK
jgi:hypothetical protein